VRFLVAQAAFANRPPIALSLSLSQKAPRVKQRNTDTVLERSPAVWRCCNGYQACLEESIKYLLSRWLGNNERRSRHRNKNAFFSDERQNSVRRHWMECNFIRRGSYTNFRCVSSAALSRLAYLLLPQKRWLYLQFGYLIFSSPYRN